MGFFGIDKLTQRKQEEMKKTDEMVRAHNETFAPFSMDKEVNGMVATMVAAIEKAGDGEPDFGGMQVEKMRKMATLAMKADANNSEVRFRPGSRLRTYVRGEDGVLKDETYGGEAFVKEGSTIYRNADPILDREGKPTRGHFEDDGTFVEDAAGSETLYNEYVTDDPTHPKRKYGIEPVAGEWTKAPAQIPSYLSRIPSSKGEIFVNTTKNGKPVSGRKIAVHGGDYVVVDALGKGETSGQAIARDFKERTYEAWNE